MCVRFECLAAGSNEDTIGREENNLKRRVLTETTSHHPEFLEKRRQLQKRTLSSSTDCYSKHSSKQTRARSLFLIITSVRIRRHCCLLLCFSLDILASNKALVNLAMFTRGYLSKTPKSPPKLVALKFSSKSDSTLSRIVDKYNVN